MPQSLVTTTFTASSYEVEPLLELEEELDDEELELEELEEELEFDEELDDELVEELELDEELLPPPQLPNVVQDASLPGILLVYQLA